MTPLTGLPDAVTSVFPDTVVQTCVVHVIRNAMAFVSYQDRKKVAAGMRAISTAPSVEAAEVELRNLDNDFGQQYPGVVDVWRRAWNEFIPFLDYLPGAAAYRLHDECDRVHQLPAPQGHQDAWALPVRRGGDEATLPRAAEHFKHERRGVRHRDVGLESGTEYFGCPLPGATPSVIG